VAALIGIFVMTLAFACYEAYVARDISTEFAETEYIAKAMGFILVVCFIGIPEIVIANEDPRAAFFVVAGIIFVISVSLLLMIFVPKARHSKLKKRKKPPLSGLTSSASRMAQAGSALQSEEDSDVAPGMKILTRPGSSRGFAQNAEGAERIETGGLVSCEQSDLHHEQTLDAAEKDVELVNATETNHH
jgi:gamma-aminobutyric acid type B receptor